MRTRWRNVRERVIEHLDVLHCPFAELDKAEARVLNVSAHRQIGTVDLQIEAGGDNCFIFKPHGRGNCFQIRVLRGIIVVAKEQGDHARGRRGYERLPPLTGADGGCKILDVDVDRLSIAECDRPVASRSLPPGSPRIAKDALCQVWEVRQVLIDERVAATAEPGKTILDVSGIARL